MKKRTTNKQERNILWESGRRLWPAGLLVLLILAVPHLLDTRAGAVESGDGWLVGGYLLTAALAVLAAAFAGLLLRRRRLETCLAAAVLMFGVIYLAVLPPLSAPDEVRHYISAYQLSNRMLGLPASGEDGKVIVREEDWFAEDSCGDYRPYRTAAGELATDEEGAEDAKVLGQTLTEETYRLIHEKGLTLYEAPRSAEAADPGAAAGEPAIPAGDAGSGLALSNHLPVVTTPVGYLAPALGITLARLLDLNSLGLLCLGRLFNLLFFTAAVWFALRRLPFGKEVLGGVALLPMTLHLAASFSYDVLIMAGIFVFTAKCLYLAYEADRVRPADVVILAAVMAAAGPCKMVYAVFMGLCLLIPVKKFGGWGKWALSAVCVLGAWAAVMVFVNGQTVASYAAETENYVSWAEEAGFSITMLLHQPVKLLQMFYNTLIWQAEHWHLTMIGAYLGNVDLVLDVPYAVVMMLTACLLGLSFRKPGETLRLTGRPRVWIWFLCAACAGATMFSMLIAWTPISSRVICGVQGRYFLPFLPVLLMTFKNDRLVLTKGADRSILYLMCCADAYVLLRIYSIVSMRL